MTRTDRRLAAVLVGASLAWPCAGALAASQLHKCVDSGRTVYQQQACSPSAQAEPVTSAPHASAKASGPTTDTASIAPRKIKAPSAAASAAPATLR